MTARFEDLLADQSLFEAVFVRALHPTGVFRDELVAIGYDPDLPTRRYPLPLFTQALRVACRHVFPNVPEGEAMRQLGKMSIESFFKTIVGRVIGAARPFLRVETAVRRVPEYSQRTVPGLELTVAQENEASWILEYQNAPQHVGWILGVLEVSFEALGGRVERIEPATPGTVCFRIQDMKRGSVG